MRSLPICLLSALVLCLGASARPPSVEVNFAGIELLENDRGWKVEATRNSFLSNSPLETGDIILKVGGQDVARLGPLSLAALLEYAQITDLGFIVDRAGQEEELSFQSSPAPGSEGSAPKVKVLGATIRSVEDTGRIMVTDILPGSPAERSGLKTDDEIVAVGGEAVGKMTFSQVVDALSKSRDSGMRIRARRASRELEVILKPGYFELNRPVLDTLPFPLHARGEASPGFQFARPQGEAHGTR